jgi:uncharacterized membrane protein HdeD (DUF308 family)
MTAPVKPPGADRDASSGADHGAWMVWIGLAGMGLGASGAFMLFALPAIGLVYYGALLCLLGAAQLSEAARAPSGGGRRILALLGAIYVAVGLALMILPGAVSALSRLVAVLFAAAGAMRIVWSLAWPPLFRPVGVVAGAAVLGLGALLLATPSGPRLWMLGGAVAFDLVAYGLSAFVLGRTLRR